MKKVAIVGVESSGKTVMLAGLGDLYTYPDEEGYFLAPKNFGTAAYVAEKIERMRKGKWPSATAGDEMQGLDWTLKRREPGVRKPAEKICEVSFLDFAGEVYRAAYGIAGGGDPTLKEQVAELKKYVRGADDLIVLINLRDVITNGLRDKHVQEAMWITKSILDTALGDDAGEKPPRAAIVLSQADSYASTIKACGGAQGVLEKYLPHVANEYGWLDVFAANAVDKTALDDDGNVVPAADFTTQGLLPILNWIRGGEVELELPEAADVADENVAEDGVSLADADAEEEGGTVIRDTDIVFECPHCGHILAIDYRGAGLQIECVKCGGSVIVPIPEPRLSQPNEQSSEYGKVQLWKDGPYWAETNIGTEVPWEPGYYFWWGDTIGYKRENYAWVASDGSSSNFCFSDREVNTPTNDRILSSLQNDGWITVDNVLALEHDAAQVQWGGDWRMPTDQELKDLCDKCD